MLNKGWDCSQISGHSVIFIPQASPSVTDGICWLLRSVLHFRAGAACCMWADRGTQTPDQHTVTQVGGCWSKWPFGGMLVQPSFQLFCISEYLFFRSLGYPEIRIFTWKSGYAEILISRNPDIRKSWYPLDEGPFSFYVGQLVYSICQSSVGSALRIQDFLNGDLRRQFGTSGKT